MNMKITSLVLALTLPASLAFAQRPAGPPPGGGPAGPPPEQEPGYGNRPPKPHRGDQNRPDKPPVPPLLHALDTDHDGIISAAEIKAAPDVLLTLDKNKDGKLTANEFAIMRPDGPPPGGPKDGERPFPGQKPAREGNQKPPGPKDGAVPKDGPQDRGDKPQRPPPPPLVGALDADHDGVISAAEIADSSAALLTLDKNNDGQLGPAEYMGHPPGERPDGDGPKPPRPPRDEQ